MCTAFLPLPAANISTCIPQETTQLPLRFLHGTPPVRPTKFPEDTCAPCPARVFRFSRGIKGKNIFTRTQLAGVLQASYTELPVNCSTLRNQGNFRGLLEGRVNRVPDITTYRAFRIEKGGDGRVKVRVKHHMHGTEWKGIGRNGDADPDASPHDLFIGHPPRIQDAPPYELKEVSDEVIRKVEQRYLASHERLAASYPLGESITSRGVERFIRGWWAVRIVRLRHRTRRRLEAGREGGFEQCPTWRQFLKGRRDHEKQIIRVPQQRFDLSCHVHCPERVGVSFYWDSSRVGGTLLPFISEMRRAFCLRKAAAQDVLEMQ